MLLIVYGNRHYHFVFKISPNFYRFLLSMLCLYLLIRIVYILFFNHTVNLLQYIYEKLPNIVTHACLYITQKDDKLWPCFYVLTHYVESLKELNSLSIIETLGCLGGLEVMHQTAIGGTGVRFPGTGKIFYVCIFVLMMCNLCFYFFCPRTLIVVECLQFFLQCLFF